MGFLAIESTSATWLNAVENLVSAVPPKSHAAGRLSISRILVPNLIELHADAARKAVTRKSFDLCLPHFSQAARPVEQKKQINRRLYLIQSTHSPSGERVLPCNAKHVTGLKTAQLALRKLRNLPIWAGAQQHCVLNKHVGSLAACSADIALI